MSCDAGLHSSPFSLRREARPCAGLFCFCAYTLHLQRDGRGGTRSRCRHGSRKKPQQAGPSTRVAPALPSEQRGSGIGRIYLQITPFYPGNARASRSAAAALQTGRPWPAAQPCGSRLGHGYRADFPEEAMRLVANTGGKVEIVLIAQVAIAEDRVHRSG